MRIQIDHLMTGSSRSLRQSQSVGRRGQLGDLRGARRRRVPGLQIRAGGGCSVQHQVVQGRPGTGQLEPLITLVPHQEFYRYLPRGIVQPSFSL